MGQKPTGFLRHNQIFDVTIEKSDYDKARGLLAHLNHTFGQGKRGHKLNVIGDIIFSKNYAKASLELLIHNFDQFNAVGRTLESNETKKLANQLKQSETLLHLHYIRYVQRIRLADHAS